MYVALGGDIKFIFGAARKHLRYNMSTTVGGAARLSFFVHFFPVKQTMSSGMGHHLKYFFLVVSQYAECDK